MTIIALPDTIILMNKTEKKRLFQSWISLDILLE